MVAEIRSLALILGFSHGTVAKLGEIRCRKLRRRGTIGFNDRFENLSLSTGR